MTESFLGWTLSAMSIVAGVLFLRNARRGQFDMDRRKQVLRLIMAMCFIYIGGLYVVLLLGIVPIFTKLGVLLARMAFVVLMAAWVGYGIVES